MLDRLNGVPSNKPFVHLVIDPELIERIDDFRFSFRLPSRSHAIRYLIEAGLEVEMPSTNIKVKKPPRPKERDQ